MDSASPLKPEAVRSSNSTILAVKKSPHVAEFPLILECRVIHSIEIGLHSQFIGEIMDVKADEALLGGKGLPDIEKVKPIVFGPEILIYLGLGKYLGQAFSIGKEL
jgi:flavin reductase (DIM6/NTAB) family NADH-FMN oxidoreductase RutF